MEEVYERFPVLKERRKSLAGNLSGGQQRMVEVGRTLMTDPKVMLVDEPTAGLAKLLSEEVYQHLVNLKDSGITILLVDQEIRQALKIAETARDFVGSMLAVGVVTIIAFQVLVNLLMTVGLMPVTGIPLPFMSYGGSNLLTMMACIGLLLSIKMRSHIF